MTQQRPDERRAAELSRLMAAYEKDILKLCCLYLQDAGMAEDAAQETFFKAYRALDRFRGECADKTWLVRIAVNTCKDMRRAAWFRFVDRRVTLDRLPEPATPPAADSVHLTLEIMRLPDRERDAVILYYYQGMTLRETAKALNVSETAVAKRLRRACGRLQLIWEGGADDA